MSKLKKVNTTVQLLEKNLNKPVNIGLFGKYINKKKITRNLESIFKTPKFFYLGEKQNYFKYQKKKLNLIIVYGYGKIFKKSFFFDNPECKIINFHLAYLSHGRGIFPNLFNVIKNKRCGFTIHLINNQKIDCEPVLFRKKVNYSKNDSLRLIFYNIKNEMDAFIDNNLKKIIFSKNNVSFKKIYKYHSRSEAENYFSQLPDGWDTKISKIQKINFK